LNKYFEAEHQQSVAHLAHGFGWDYEVISEKIDMSDRISKFLLRKEGKSILEIVTDQEMNARDLQHFFDSIKTNITNGIS
jgi:2-succinyl-5-enolpyruvyl-6-hydroxy-3-cyclohexene-1-carboxylate synthase